MTVTVRLKLRVGLGLRLSVFPLAKLNYTLYERNVEGLLAEQDMCFVSKVQSQMDPGVVPDRAMAKYLTPMLDPPVRTN